MNEPHQREAGNVGYFRVATQSFSDAPIKPSICISRRRCFALKIDANEYIILNEDFIQDVEIFAISRMSAVVCNSAIPFKATNCVARMG